MSVHPDFSDSVRQYVNQHLAEWDAANPRPLPSPERPEALDPLVSKHSTGHIMLGLNGAELQVTVSTPKGSFFFFLNTGLLQALLENLLTAESAMLEHHEWVTGGDAGRQWNTERSRFIEQTRKEYIAQYEHRDLKAEEVQE
jgi:hypothetical protein